VLSVNAETLELCVRHSKGDNNMKRTIKLAVLTAAIALSQSAWSAMTVPAFPADADASYELAARVTFADLHKSDQGGQMFASFPASLVMMIDD
jgi:hypothetical protein